MRGRIANPSLALWCAAALAAPSSLPAADAGLQTRNVVLITLDGVRIQELFGGMDPVIAADEQGSGIYDAEALRERYWREDPQTRREVLMPFFWKTLAPQGVVLGNKARGSSVTVQNAELFSYPGYSEIVTGRPHPQVRSNDLVRYPRETALDYLAGHLGGPKTTVSQLGSWDGFAMAASHAEGTFFTNGAFEAIPAGLSTPDMDRLTTLRRQVQQFWDESSNDMLSFQLALAWLRHHRPRMMWLGLSQSDDWAHARRYDLLLDYLHLVDQRLEELWTTLQSLDAYRGRTTLILTTDHGRGIRPEDWVEHGEGIPGCEDIWVAVIGLDTPQRGELSSVPTVHQGDVAATVLRLFGLDARDYSAEARPPIAAALEPAP